MFNSVTLENIGEQFCSDFLKDQFRKIIIRAEIAEARVKELERAQIVEFPQSRIEAKQARRIKVLEALNAAQAAVIDAAKAVIHSHIKSSDEDRKLTGHGYLRLPTVGQGITLISTLDKAIAALEKIEKEKK